MRLCRRIIPNIDLETPVSLKPIWELTTDNAIFNKSSYHKEQQQTEEKGTRLVEAVQPAN